MKILILFILILSNSVYGYEYLGQMLLNDLTSGDKYRMGFTSGYIRGVASITEYVCIPQDEKKNMYQEIIDYLSDNQKDLKYPANITIQMALLARWECKYNRAGDVIHEYGYR